MKKFFFGLFMLIAFVCFFMLIGTAGKYETDLTLNAWDGFKDMLVWLCLMTLSGFLARVCYDDDDDEGGGKYAI